MIPTILRYALMAIAVLYLMEAVERGRLRSPVRGRGLDRVRGVHGTAPGLAVRPRRQAAGGGRSPGIVL